MSAKEQIYERMQGSGLSYTDQELAAALGLNANTVRRARRELVIEGRIEDFTRFAGQTAWIAKVSQTAPATA